MRIMLAFLLVLAACGKAEKAMQVPSALPDYVFSPCAVLKDYLIERRRFLRFDTSGGEIVPEFVEEYGERFRFIDTTPLWTPGKLENFGLGSSERTSETTSRVLDGRYDFLFRRMKRQPSAAVIQAYRDVQSRDFSYEECAFPEKFKTGETAKAEVIRRIKFNEGLRKEEGEFRNKINKLRWVEKKPVDKETEKLKRQEFRSRRLRYTKYQFSRVGVDREARQALFYYEHFCGMLCAGGNYVLMELYDGHWRQVGNEMVWVS